MSINLEESFGRPLSQINVLTQGISLPLEYGSSLCIGRLTCVTTLVLGSNLNLRSDPRLNARFVCR